MQKSKVIQECVSRLRSLPGVREVDFRATAPLGPCAESAGLLKFAPAGGPVRSFCVNARPGVVTSEVAARLLSSWPRNVAPAAVLFAEYVMPDSARILAERGLSFVDAAGNTHLRSDNGLHLWVEGRKRRPTPPAKRGLGCAGYQVVFGLLTTPELLDATVRDIASATAASKSTASNTLQWLAQRGYLVEVDSTRRIPDRDKLLDLWLSGYQSTVRPNWFVGRYRMPLESPSDLERHAEQRLKDDAAITWAWGGAAAAFRLVRTYRGEETVLHVADHTEELPRRLGAVRSDSGSLIVIETPRPTFFNGLAPRTVHPLLVYSELAISPDPRATELARVLYDRHLSDSATG